MRKGVKKYSSILYNDEIQGLFEKNSICKYSKLPRFLLY
jgi:hypothetical protein